jgi:hypothetical protein
MGVRQTPAPASPLKAPFRSSSIARFLLPLVVVAVVVESPLTPADDTPTLDELLPRLSRFALLYWDTALRFACKERINWERIEGSGKETFAYVFTHDEEKGFQDFRMHTGWAANRRNPRKLHPTAPAHLSSAFLWVFVFRDSRQPFHRYTVTGEERMHGRDAVRIEFEPVPPIQNDVNDWYGTAWVDRETSQLLRVEAYSPDDHAVKLRLDDHLANAYPNDWNYDLRRIVTDFTTVENGMRFPGRVEIHRTRHRVRSSNGYVRTNAIPLLKVTQTYRNYRFFSTRTEEEILGFIAGDREIDLGSTTGP